MVGVSDGREDRTPGRTQSPWVASRAMAVMAPPPLGKSGDGMAIPSCSHPAQYRVFSPSPGPRKTPSPPGGQHGWQNGGPTHPFPLGLFGWGVWVGQDLLPAPALCFPPAGPRLPPVKKAGQLFPCRRVVRPMPGPSVPLGPLPFGTILVPPVFAHRTPGPAHCP